MRGRGAATVSCDGLKMDQKFESLLDSDERQFPPPGGLSPSRARRNVCVAQVGDRDPFGDQAGRMVFTEAQ